MTTVIYHSADYDGLFSREVAKKFLGTEGVQYIGWDFGQPLIPMPNYGTVYIIDLSPDCVAMPPNEDISQHSHRIVWIDHHKSSIDKWRSDIPGYRIDGVAACRLAWHWFHQRKIQHHPTAGSFAVVLAEKQKFVDRVVDEPLAVTLAGEYDVWDHAKSDGKDVAFQFGLDCQEVIPWAQILEFGYGAENITGAIVAEGGAAMRCYAKRDADVMNTRSFTAEFEGLKFLCLNTARCNSNTFAAKDVPETGHDALMAFYYTGKGFSCSLYHAAHRKDIDLSLIATKYGGGGHRGACGFRFSNFHLTDGKFQIL